MGELGLIGKNKISGKCGGRKNKALTIWARKYKKMNFEIESWKRRVIY